jgi:hypothetical protein
MKSLLAVVFATVYGLCVRLLFGFLGDVMGIMSIGFLIFLPVVIGYLTIALMPRHKTRTAGGAFLKPWLTSLVILILTILINVEGRICWIMIFPLFGILAGFGGVIAYFIRKRDDTDLDNNGKNDWDRFDTLKTSFVLFIPVFVSLIEGDRTLKPKEFTIERQVAIDAAPEVVWHELTNLGTLSADEKGTSFATILGFPHYLKTTLDTPAVGGKRMAYYEKGLYFEETITKYEPEKLMVLDIKTDPNKIPPTVMDEHIVIGGKHVDILEDTYKLEMRKDGNSHLTLTGKFYINTPFNWYAGIWAEYLMNDILDEQLHLIRERAVEKSNKQE